MSDMDLDLSICGRHPVILERQAIPLNDQVWLWSPETSFNSTPKRAKKLEIVQSLIAGIENEDFDHESSDTSSEKPSKTDSGIESMPSMDVLYWEAPKIEIGMTYLVPNKRGKWVKAKLVEIKDSQLCLVGLQRQERIVSDFLSLVHPEPVLGLLPVGSRVVAHHRAIATTGEIKRTGRLNFQLGVVAELPSKLNKSRYLVIFDNGSWNYVESELVHPGYYTSDKIWEVVPTQNRKIVKEFLNGHYESVIDWKCKDQIWVKTDSDEDGAQTVDIIQSLTAGIDFSYWEVPKIETGLTYFVPNKLGKWVKAKLVEIKGSELFLVGLQTQERIVSDFLSLAHPEPVLELIAIGSRVVAHFCRITATGEIKRKGRRNFQLGVVAELPTDFNRLRYLVIFDNGLWNYVMRELVHPGYYTSDKIWEVVPIENRKTVLEFLNGFYEAFIELKVGDQILVKSTCGEYTKCSVLATDANLLLIWFILEGRSEWLHKGSPNILIKL